MIACFAGHLDIVKLLRSKGAAWTAKDLGGCTAMHWAADGGYRDVIEWMIDDGCEVWVYPCNASKALDSLIVIRSPTFRSLLNRGSFGGNVV